MEIYPEDHRSSSRTFVGQLFNSQPFEVSYLPVGVGLRPQCQPTKKEYPVDDCLRDNYLGLVMCFGCEICLYDMLCVVGISFP